MPDRPRVHDPRAPTVRPRLVWSGIVLGLLAAAVASVAMMAGHAWLAWGAGLVGALALLLAWRGGVMFDTRGQEPPHHELRELARGGEHRGVSPEARAVGPEVEARAAQLTARQHHILSRTASAPHRRWRPAAAWMLVVVGAWLVIGQWALNYPFTVVGQDNALRDLGLAVVVVLCGLRLRLPTRSPVASALCALSGALLVASALLLPHDSVVVSANELLTGLAVLGLTVPTLAS